MANPCDEGSLETLKALRWKKYPVGSDGFICLVDVMGDDAAVVSAARVSYGVGTKKVRDDRNLIRYLYRHGHLTPFEMVEFKFLVRCPMDVWRQWIRHRTASVNEYSTRYSEAIDSCARTAADGWRLQSNVNKQGSSDYVRTWPEGFERPKHLNHEVFGTDNPGMYLSLRERSLHEVAREVYEERLKFGVAREQARKDLPLSNYTEAYWKCDLRNIMNFLSLRMDNHAQLEIREFANAMYEIVKQVCPLTMEAFDEYDFRRNGLLLTGTEVKLVGHIIQRAIGRMLISAAHMNQLGMDTKNIEQFYAFMRENRPEAAAKIFDKNGFHVNEFLSAIEFVGWPKPPAKCRERDEALEKFKRLGLIDDRPGIKEYIVDVIA